MKNILLTTLFLFCFSINANAANEKWGIQTSKDEMTGEASVYVSSANVAATRALEFPYHGLKSWIGAGCKTGGKGFWVYIGFNIAPNLNDTETEDGYNAISTRIKWDDDIKFMNFTQDWGAKFIHFRDDATAIEKIKKSKNVLFELNWHGQGRVYFKYSLDGAARVIKQAEKSCS